MEEKRLDENLEDFEITENSENIDKLQEILDFDFASDAEFDIENHYKNVQDYKTERVNLKNMEAENVIKDLGPKYAEHTYLEEMNKCKENFYALIKRYDPNSEKIKSMTEVEKDRIYGVAQFIKNSYIEFVNNLLFNITWTREEYKFLKNIFKQKMEFTGNEIFNSFELKQKYLDPWEEIDKVLPNGEPMNVAIDIKNIVMMYHFLGEYKISGMGKSYMTFLSIIQKIADTNKIYNAYNIEMQRVEETFTLWAGNLTPEIADRELAQQNTETNMGNVVTLPKDTPPEQFPQ
jgi:hypothetical protein